MKIDATSSVYSVERYRTQAAKLGQAMQAMPEAKDKVDVSEAAVSFSEAFIRAKASIDEYAGQVHSAVEITRAQVTSGTYTVNADEVASAILLF